MLLAVESYGRAIWRARGSTEEAARLVAIVLARRASSSADALRRTLERRRALLAGAPPEDVQPELPWAESEDGDGPDADRLLGVAGFEDAEEERLELERLLALSALAAQAPAKVRWLQRFLSRTREPVVIFSEYRDTVADLCNRLRAHDVEILHGGLTPQLRAAAIDRFVSGRARVLLATDAAGEGVNLQQRCRTVVNVELPWNPVRLEQRLGRVDRLGQSRRVHAIHLLHAGSIEERVLAGLARRVSEASRAGGLAEEIVGTSTVGAVAAAAFLDERPSRFPTMRVSSARVEDAASELQRLAVCRRMAALASNSRRPVSPRARCPEPAGTAIGRPLVTPAGGLPATIICAFEVVMVEARGLVVARYAVAVAIALGSTVRFIGRTARGLVRSIEADGELHAAIRARAEAQCADDSAAARRSANAYVARLDALIEDARSTPLPLVQTSLFDSRSQRLAAEGAASRAARLEALVRRREAISKLAEVKIGALPRLIAAWPAIESPVHAR
jgi:hypothetical protein